MSVWLVLLVARYVRTHLEALSVAAILASDCKQTILHVQVYYNSHHYDVHTSQVAAIIFYSFTDIDECSGVNDCQQGCTNTEGSFVCTCQAGFMLNVDERACDREFDRIVFNHSASKAMQLAHSCLLIPYVNDSEHSDWSIGA